MSTVTSKEKKLLFVHNSKCGGSSVNNLIYNNEPRNFGLNRNFKEYDIHEFKKTLSDENIKSLDSGYTKSIICIRDPFDRFFSATEFINKQMTTENMVKTIYNDETYEKNWWYGQCRKLSSREYISQALENLEKFDVIFNVSMMDNPFYVKKLQEDMYKKLGWAYTNLKQKRNVSLDRNKKSNIQRQTVLNELSNDNLDYLKEKLEKDILFYDEAVKLIKKRYKLS